VNKTWFAQSTRVFVCDHQTGCFHQRQPWSSPPYILVDDIPRAEASTAKNGPNPVSRALAMDPPVALASARDPPSNARRLRTFALLHLLAALCFVLCALGLFTSHDLRLQLTRREAASSLNKQTSKQGFSPVNFIPSYPFNIWFVLLSVWSRNIDRLLPELAEEFLAFVFPVSEKHRRSTTPERLKLLSIRTSRRHIDNRTRIKVEKPRHREIQQPWRLLPASTWSCWRAQSFHPSSTRRWTWPRSIFRSWRSQCFCSQPPPPLLPNPKHSCWPKQMDRQQGHRDPGPGRRCRHWAHLQPDRRHPKRTSPFHTTLHYSGADQTQPDIKALQIQLTGFLDKDTPAFCKELWKLLLSAQNSPQGVPKELLEAKKLELMQEKVGTVIWYQCSQTRHADSHADRGRQGRRGSPQAPRRIRAPRPW